WPGNNYGVYLDQGFVGAWHNGWILDDGFGNNVFPRDQANASVTQFVGTNHELKFGIDYQDTKWEGEQHRTSLYSGYVFDAFNPYGYKDAGIAATKCSFALPNNACLFRDYNADFLTSDRGTGDSEVENTALYIRDRFTLGDHWTFNVGFRAENQKGLNDIRRTVFEDDYVSPRFSTSYDIKGDGGMLVSLNVGRYHALLNQAWIYQRLDDQWQGTRGFRDILFCSPLDVALGNTAGLFNHPLFAQCRVKGVGYNAIFRDFADITIWDLVDQGFFESDITPYFKDEAILGFEWQFARNWALDTKALYWDLEDMIGSTVQLGPRGEQFELAANYKDYPAILARLEAARLANGLPPQVSQETLDNFQEGIKRYKALQAQVNRRFSGGWALYNNITWSETRTTGSGAWWNNTNSEYGEELHVVLTPAMITQCQAAQAARSHPVDCAAKLTPFLGQPVSTINRLGVDNNTDRPIIFNSFGFKRFDLGTHDVTVGGHLSFQSGIPWVREETLPTSFLTGGNAASDSVLVLIDPFGAAGRRTPSVYTLNMSTAWGFPLGWKALRGEARVEVLNVTNQQRLQLLEFGRLSGRPGEAGLGDAYPTRRAFQRPRQVRANLTVRF
ncbi:MAG TPA: TonB-dependent receptor, partial [Planctomycetota bacterium]|nr:TonB-dependent receptor [Planctomycetota bacterium]